MTVKESAARAVAALKQSVVADPRALAPYVEGYSRAADVAYKRSEPQLKATLVEKRKAPEKAEADYRAGRITERARDIAREELAAAMWNYEQIYFVEQRLINHAPPDVAEAMQKKHRDRCKLNVNRDSLKGKIEANANEKRLLEKHLAEWAHSHMTGAIYDDGAPNRFAEQRAEEIKRLERLITACNDDTAETAAALAATMKELDGVDAEIAALRARCWE